MIPTKLRYLSKLPSVARRAAVVLAIGLPLPPGYAAAPDMRGLLGAFTAPPAAASAPRLSSQSTVTPANSVIAGADTDIAWGLNCAAASAGTGPGATACIGTMSLAFTGADLTLSMRNPGTGGLSCSVAGTVVNCAVAVPINTRGTTTIRLRPSPDARGTITATSSGQGNFHFQPGTHALPLTAEADVSLIQTPDPTPVVAGATAPEVFTKLVVVNQGPSALLNPKITETFPSDMDIEFPAPGICTFTKPTLHCDQDRLEPGQSFSVSFGASVPGWYPSELKTATLNLVSDPVSKSAQPQFFVAGDTLAGWQILSDASPKVGADVTDHVMFINVVPAGQAMASLTWALRLDNPSGVRVTKVVTDDPSGELACQVTGDARGVVCAGPQITAAKQASATVTLHADTAGSMQGLTLTWTSGQVSGQSKAALRVLPASSGAGTER